MTEHVAGPRPIDLEPEPVALEHAPQEPASSGWRGRRLGAVAVLAFVALVAASVGVAMASRAHGPARVDDRRHHHTNDPHLKLGKGPARVAVLSALSATTAAHSFDVSYTLSETLRRRPRRPLDVDGRLPGRSGAVSFGGPQLPPADAPAPFAAARRCASRSG